MSSDADTPDEPAQQSPTVDGDGGFESGTVRTNDVETYYVRQGEGPPIVFVHGMAMSATQWEP